MKVPFGLCNSPAVFQRFINKNFWPLIKANIVVVYMDDLIVPAKDEKENVMRLRQVLDVAQMNALCIGFSKCQFVKKRVTFLGHILENGTVQPSEEKTRAIRQFPVPQNIKQVQSFMGLAGYFRKFVASFSVIAKPLTDLTRKDVQFVFGTKQHDAFNALKEALCKDPVLEIFSPSRETELHTDASAMGYGACLLQKNGAAEWHPIFYFSSKTTDAESRYSSYELEVLAIVKALKKLRVYLLGINFVIFTDCQAFNFTMKKRDLCARVARWALQLEEFDCTVQHRAGTSMRHVGALSRIPSVLVVEDKVLQSIKKSQADDTECKAIREVLKKQPYENYVLRCDILYKGVDGRFLLFVPKVLQSQIIRSVHEHGHISAAKVEAIVKQEYAIENLHKRVTRVLANCAFCRREKQENKRGCTIR